ncbi:RNA-binding S4 domain-containing protein [Ancylobacter vacuolatus]|uniref:Ribosome-associated heat shock protein Hsp15 n=1 Tax=Ancylobacter vacuolatus TaxID=223389 RepID=A0ABU0DEH0_9HYPH|nr:S4 domain-containing protein [Ancylobacter vacuolatus]MDQ0346779.1 ribosome-associated heat shock protein Hsp15 [Ancylobacter vacuolatus]
MRGAGDGSGPQLSAPEVSAAEDSAAETRPERQRLDVWLFHARCVRTRSAAAQLVKAGRVRLNGARITAPSQPVRRGDVLTLSLDSRVRLWRVIGFIARRGDAPAALTTYVEVAPEAAPGAAPGSHAS